jgi:hypothetical protein
MAAESCMLGFVLGSVPLSTAKLLCGTVSGFNERLHLVPYIRWAP